jgi:hypothetical protein
VFHSESEEERIEYCSTFIEFNLFVLDVTDFFPDKYSGAVSVPIALMAIFIHYKLICSKIKHGGMTEIIVALLLCIWWIVAVSLLTADCAVASTIQGTQVCDNDYVFLGNNLYLSLWAGLYSSVQLCLKWKATQAMVMSNVAKTQHNGSLRSDRQEEVTPDGNDEEDF